LDVTVLQATTFADKEVVALLGGAQKEPFTGPPEIGR